MTSLKMKKKFKKNGWNNVNFRELTQEEAIEKGYLLALNSRKKFFVMINNGNIYDENGTIIMFNISCCR